MSCSQVVTLEITFDPKYVDAPGHWNWTELLDAEVELVSVEQIIIHPDPDFMVTILDDQDA
jgi:hypothetical protein